MDQLIGGPLNEEADLQQALSLFIRHVVLICNNTAVENMRPLGPSKVNDVLQVERGRASLAHDGKPEQVIKLPPKQREQILIEFGKV